MFCCLHRRVCSTGPTSCCLTLCRRPAAAAAPLAGRYGVGVQIMESCNSQADPSVYTVRRDGGLGPCKHHGGPAPYLADGCLWRRAIFPAAHPTFMLLPRTCRTSPRWSPGSKTSRRACRQVGGCAKRGGRGGGGPPARGSSRGWPARCWPAAACCVTQGSPVWPERSAAPSAQLNPAVVDRNGNLVPSSLTAKPLYNYAMKVGPRTSPPLLPWAGAVAPGPSPPEGSQGSLDAVTWCRALCTRVSGPQTMAPALCLLCGQQLNPAIPPHPAPRRSSLWTRAQVRPACWPLQPGPIQKLCGQRGAPRPTCQHIETGSCQPRRLPMGRLRASLMHGQA